MSRRPDRTTMEGMIYNANEVLQQALSPGVAGVPKTLFQLAKGLAILSVVEVGFIFSGNVGTGILLARKADGTWSPPSALGLTGVGWGLLVGGSIKNILVFLMDDGALDAAMTDSGLKFGGQVEVTLGLGRTGAMDLNLSNQGASGTISIAFTKGAFLGLNIEGALVGARRAANEHFYGGFKAPRDILQGNVEIPSDKVTMIDEVYDKLAKLEAAVVVAETSEEEEAKKAKAEEEAHKAAESLHQIEDVVHVDAAEEAAKESMAKTPEESAKESIGEAVGEARKESLGEAVDEVPKESS